MYLHQQRLAQAVKQLYMLGNKPYTERNSGVEDLGTGAASFIGAVRDRKTAPKVHADPAKNAQYNAFVDETGAKKGLAQEAIKALAKKSQQDLSTHSMAEETRMGGQFTPGGLELADQNSFLNGQDRLKMKAMIQGPQLQPLPQGIGGSFPGAERGFQ